MSTSDLAVLDGGRSLFHQAMRRLVRNRLAVFGMVVVGVIAVAAIIVYGLTVVADEKVPVPSPKSTETVPELVAKSVWPSPFRSPRAIPHAPFGSPKLAAAAKVPFSVPSKTETEPGPGPPMLWLVTAMSRCPSPFTSADTIETGSLPVAKVCWAANVAVVAPL